MIIFHTIGQHYGPQKCLAKASWLIIVIMVIMLGSTVLAIESQNADPFALKPNDQRVCLSLRVLSRLVSGDISSGKAIAEACHTMGGISYIEGYIIDPLEPQDIILFGISSKDRPSLRLDDLIVNMRAISDGPQYPYCSLDPRPEDVKALRELSQQKELIDSPGGVKAFFERLSQTVGPQIVVIGGIQPNSHMAHVMIDADYHMKKVSQGSVNIDGVTSYLDHSLNESKSDIQNGRPISGNQISRARFWFHIDKMSPTFQCGKDIVALDKCKVIVLAEKQMDTEAGELVDVAEDDPHAIAFSSDISNYLSEGNRSRIESYAELENLFRLRSLLLAIDFQSSFESIGWSFSNYITKYAYIDEEPMASSMPGLANYKEWSYSYSRGSTVYTLTLYPMVCGGVDMDMIIYKYDFRDDISPRLLTLRESILTARKSKDDLFWSVP